MRFCPSHSIIAQLNIATKRKTSCLKISLLGAALLNAVSPTASIKKQTIGRIVSKRFTSENIYNAPLLKGHKKLNQRKIL